MFLEFIVEVAKHTMNAHERQKSHASKNHLKNQLRQVISLVFLILFLVVSFFYLNFSWNRYKRTAASEAVILAQSLESMIHPEHIMALSGNLTDLTKPEYEMSKTDLMRLVKTTNPLRFAYILGQKNGDTIILVDSEPPDSTDYSPPGQIYDEIDPSYLIPFQSGQTILTEAVTDRWGTWISALTPIKDPDGQVLAVFGIDYSAAEWQARLYRQMIPDCIVVISLFLLVVLLLYVQTKKSVLKTLSDNLAYDEALYHNIFTQAPIGIALVKGGTFVVESVYGHTNINPIFEQILGRTSAELDNLSWQDITHPDDIEKDLELFARFKSGEFNQYELEKRFIRPDGSVIWTHMQISKLIGLPGRNTWHLCLIEDITAHKEAEQKLSESERSKSVLLSNLPGMAYRCLNDRNWTMQFVSDGCHALTGYLPKNLINNRDLSYNDLISPEYQDVLWQMWTETLANRSSFKYEYEIITASGEPKWVLELGEGVFNDAGDMVALEGIILDITDRKAVEEQLRYTAEHDLWTGLYNRKYLENLLNREAERPLTGRTAIIGINLNTMYLLSLTYGFGYTQTVMRTVAEALSEFCSETRMLFSSYEYRLVFYIKDYKNRDELESFCEAVARTLSPFLTAERIGGGIGVLEINDNNRHDVDRMLKNVLLTTEKSMKHDDSEVHVLFFDETMETQIDRENRINRELVQISEGINSERLYLQFQPVLDINSNKICGFESLARLNSESLGIIPPIEFIQLAEKNKLIVPLGDVIIFKALQFLKKLEANGYSTISVSVNISAIQLMRDDFSKNLIDRINRWQINPTNVGLELTESIFTSNYDEVNRVINGLRTKGIKIAIDDFGTGYSSLAREREIHADYLKIDKYFIDKLLDANQEGTITSDIISIGHKLGHCVIAEGVEHESQLQYLKEHGCDMVQGYWISRPLDEDKAIEQLNRYNQGSNC
jgi:PAS domain S-box-containing protein